MFITNTELGIFKKTKNTSLVESKKSTNNLKKKEMTQKTPKSSNAEIQIKKAEEYLKKINMQLSDRLSRIEKIKNSHERFEEQLEILQASKNSPKGSFLEMVDEAIEVPEAIRVNTELSDLVEKYAEEKLDLLRKLFNNEKKQTKEITKKLKKNLSDIAITEQRLKIQRDNLEVELQEKTKRLLQVERLSAIGELSARLAHDLRNPLTVIKGVVEIAKMKKTDDSGFSSKQIEMMERAISRMSNQIDDVLEFVKVQSLRATKNSVLETLGLSLAKIKKPNNVTINIPDKDVEFVYDADKIEVVFDNLLTNAIQAIDENGEITVRIKDLENDVIIEFEDSGKGVPDDLLPKIFEPLFTTKKRGTGLGLASCKSIIEQHGGRISARNKPSVFTIKLPKMLEISTI